MIEIVWPRGARLAYANLYERLPIICRSLFAHKVMHIDDGMDVEQFGFA